MKTIDYIIIVPYCLVGLFVFYGAIMELPKFFLAIIILSLVIWILWISTKTIKL